MKIELQINNYIIDKDGKQKISDVPPFIKNDRTFVPLRFISETLNYNVKWNDDTKTVTIYPLMIGCQKQLFQNYPI